MLAVLLALGSAAFFAVAATLQQVAASRTASRHPVDAGLLLKLVRRPLWLAGFAAVMVHFSLQASALGTGRLLLVEPVLATGLLFALPLSAWVTRRRMSRRDWLGAAAATGGLAAFVVLAAPHGGRSEVATTVLAPLTAAVVTVAVTAGVVAARLVTRARAVLLGAAAGIGGAGTDAATKTVAAFAGAHAAHVFADPRLLMLAVVGLTSFTLQQNAYRTAGLAACLPVMYVLQPVTGCLFGVLVYHEQVDGGAALLAGEIVAAVVAVWGIARLARSPLVDLARAPDGASGTVVRRLSVMDIGNRDPSHDVRHAGVAPEQPTR